MPEIQKDHQKFKGSFQNLYTVSTLFYNKSREYVAELAVSSPRFTVAYFDERATKIKDAENLPTADERNKLFKDAHNLLNDKRVECADLWQRLKRYIKRNFSKDEWEMQWMAAGSNKYKDSGKRDGKYDVFEEMMQMAVRYINENETRLLSNNTMPPAFKDQFTEAAAAFTALRLDFNQKQEQAESGTDQKLKVSNELYEILVEDMKDAILVFNDNPVLAKFTAYSRMLTDARGNKPSGMKGVIVFDDNGNPAPNVTVFTLQHGGRSVTTDGKGKYKIEVPSGATEFFIEGPGIEPVTIAKLNIPVGVMKRRNYRVNRIPSPAAVQPSADPSALEKAVLELQSSLNGATVASENGMETVMAKG